MLHSRKFQLHFYVCYTTVCTDEVDGRTLAIRSAVKCKQVVRTNLIYNSVKLLKEQRSRESLEASWASCYYFCQFREDCVNVSEFRCSRISGRYVLV